MKGPDANPKFEFIYFVRLIVAAPLIIKEDKSQEFESVYFIELRPFL